MKITDTAKLFPSSALALIALLVLSTSVRAAGHCECVGCELGRGMAVYRYSYDPASEDSMKAGRTAMSRAHDQAVTDAHALHPLCDAPCAASGVTYSFAPPPSFLSTDTPGHGEAHAHWRVTGICKKPPEPPQHRPQTSVPPETPPTTGTTPTPTGTAIAPNAGINGEIAREMKIKDGDTVAIAPMTKKGDSTPGTFVPVPAGDPFGGLLGIPGITPGVTDPETLKGKPGVLDIIKKGQSQVINTDGSRATMGYFIRVTHADGTTETYFILMSYDFILVNGKPLAAFEVFKFGPLTSDPNAQPALIGGLAVDAKGNLLPAVPLDLAKVRNFDGQSPADKPVTPGVDKPEKGCLECHSQSEDFPSDTLPFPWVPKPKKPEKTDNRTNELLRNLSIGIGIGEESGGGHHGHNHENETPPQNGTPPQNNAPPRNNTPPPPH